MIRKNDNLCQPRGRFWGRKCLPTPLLIVVVGRNSTIMLNSYWKVAIFAVFFSYGLLIGMV